jgi:hypothetical protein
MGTAADDLAQTQFKLEEALDELKVINELLDEYGIERCPDECVDRTLFRVELLRQMWSSLRSELGTLANLSQNLMDAKDEPTRARALMELDTWLTDPGVKAMDHCEAAKARDTRIRKEAIDEARGLDTDRRVRFYEHDFYVLSNFSAFQVWWRGCTWPTSEHAYHSAKFDNEATRDAILMAPSAHEAFKLAEKSARERRATWLDERVGVMREILFAKAKQHEYVRRKLLATGDRELVEDSWRDDFWGWGPNRDGQNMLGKLWMEVRSELRAAEAK